MRRIERILFVRTDRMGDVLMNLPALRLLRQCFPKAWITLVADRSLRGLLDGHSDLDEILWVEASSLRRRWAARRALCRQLRRASFDLAVVSNPDKWMHWAVWWSRIPCRIGYGRKWGFFLNQTVSPRSAAGSRHEMEANLELVRKICDRAWDGQLSLPVNERARERVDAWIRESSLAPEIVAIHPGTSHPAKRWPPERFAEVADRLRQNRGSSVVLVGGMEERDCSETVKRCSKTPPPDWTGALSLAELVAFLSHPRVKLLISSDSGPAHIAWIQGRVPVVVLFSKDAPGSDPGRWGPRDAKSAVIHQSMSVLSSDEVYAAAENVLATA